MVAEGIAAALARFPGLVSVGVATNALEGERRAEHADAVALDTGIPNAEDVARRLRRRGVRVVFLGPARGDAAAACVPTQEPVSSLARALVPPGVWGEGDRQPASRLTKREGEILRLLAGGFAGKQVATHLGISVKTVEQHKSRIFAKLKVPNQTAAVSVLVANAGGVSR
jgi:DNA-binding NarL/FixJ family response regulator